ncbi:MAG TPA: ATP-binding protein [Pyrinomonadaceae bacterium]|nr:ATP-binding protein [Pyrinomonadaceae bacterium]
MATTFKPKTLKFTLRDIGSELVDQLSSDVYSGPGSILRELVKNAYDSYLGVDQDELDDEGVEREIVISRERTSKKDGRLIVADRGIGLTVDELKAFVQLSLCTKREELENATGFRGLGSWAVLGGGAKIVVTSYKKGTPSESQLIIDVRRIYKKMAPTVTLDDILNDPKCISFGERPAGGAIHGTAVEIICDGPPTLVNGHELNRLYEHTDPKDQKLRNLIVQTCPIPFSSEGGAYKRIRQIYELSGYIPTHLSLDGDRLERGLPEDLPEPDIHDIMIGTKIAAKAWVTTSPKYSGEVRGIEDKHLLGGSSIQLMKLNVPIGAKAIYSDGVVRATILNWYVGEVHILLRDVQPDASGQDLRAGTVRDAFMEALQGFYRRLEDQAERKSIALSMARKLRQGVEAAESVKKASISPADKAQEEAKIATAIKIIESTSSRKKPKNTKEQREREAVQDPQVQSARHKARAALIQEGWFAKFGSKKTSSSKKKKASRKDGARKQTPSQLITVSELQSRLGRAMPRFTAIGLGSDQIQQVFEIINDLLSAE